MVKATAFTTAAGRGLGVWLATRSAATRFLRYRLLLMGPQELREQVFRAAGDGVVVVDLDFVLAGVVTPGANTDHGDLESAAEGERLVALAHGYVEVEGGKLGVRTPLVNGNRFTNALVRFHLGDNAGVVLRVLNDDYVWVGDAAIGHLDAHCPGGVVDVGLVVPVLLRGEAETRLCDVGESAVVCDLAGLAAQGGGGRDVGARLSGRRTGADELGQQ